MGLLECPEETTLISDPPWCVLDQAIYDSSHQGPGSNNGQVNRPNPQATYPEAKAGLLKRHPMVKPSPDHKGPRLFLAGWRTWPGGRLVDQS